MSDVTKNELDSATDRLTDLLKQAEERFSAENLGVDATVIVDPTETQWLAWLKRGSKWHLVYGYGEHEVPLLLASRRARILAAYHLKPLRDAVRKNALTTQAELDEGIIAAMRFLEVDR